MEVSERAQFLAAFGGPARVIVVAEIGNNHEGDFGLAREMVASAAECGADAVKFQHFVPQRYVANSESTRLARLQQFALTNDQVLSLFEFSRALGLEPFATAFDVETQNWLAAHQRVLKIASGDNTFLDLLNAAGKSELPTIISTGFLAHQQILNLESTWNSQFSTPLAFLHCVAAYPASFSELNLKSISSLSREMPSTPVGFSDHSTGITSSLAAAALGAFLIEKHFTLDHDQSDFRDHQLSANPQEFEELVQGVRNIEHSLGDGMKVTTMNESLQLQVVRRSAAASHRLPAGTKISKQDIIYLRPGNGYTPDRESELLGQVLSRSVAEGETITDSDVTHS